MQARVNHLVPSVAQRACDDFCAAIVSIESGFRDEDA